MKPFVSRDSRPETAPDENLAGDSFDFDVEFREEASSVEHPLFNNHTEKSVTLSETSGGDDSRDMSAPQAALEVDDWLRALLQASESRGVPEEANPIVDSAAVEHFDQDFGILQDLYNLLENLKAVLSDVSTFPVARARKTLVEILGEGSIFVRSTSRQRKFQQEIRQLKTREQLLNWLSSTISKFTSVFDPEISLS